MLTVENLSKSFKRQVIERFSYRFPATGLCTLRGASGSGKTTLLRLLAGLEKPDEGEILWEKKPSISFVFQDARLVPSLTLLDNILLVKRKKEKALALEILEKLGLSEDAEKMPHALSGGMKLRGALARSLYFGGNVFLWDEPTKELDEENRKIVYSILQDLSKNALVIVATHDEEISGEMEITL